MLDYHIFRPNPPPTNLLIACTCIIIIRARFRPRLSLSTLYAARFVPSSSSCIVVACVDCPRGHRP